MPTSFDQGAESLVLWSKYQAELSIPEGKTSTRKHLESVRQSYIAKGASEEELKDKFPELYEVEVPVAMMYLKGVFAELHKTRPPGMVGLMPITYQEMLAFNTLTDQGLTHQDIVIIKRMDAAFLEVINTREATN